MDQAVLWAIAAAAIIALATALVVFLRQRGEQEAPPPETPLASSTEGEKLCPSCGMGNLWTDTTCVSCGKRLP
jgi:hypothetical protein